MPENFEHEREAAFSAPVEPAPINSLEDILAIREKNEAEIQREKEARKRGHKNHGGLKKPSR